MSTRSRLFSGRSIRLLIATFVLAWGTTSTAETGSRDHSAHGHHDHAGHAGHDTERDDEGRRLYGMEHRMPAEMYDELRRNVARYADYPDAQIDLSMERMGPEYQWYISPDDLQGDAGVIVMMHGFRERGDRIFRERIQPVADRYPTSMALGMSMMMSKHIQLSIDDLEAVGVERIVVVPVVTNRDNDMYRQWRYIFGLRDEPTYATVPRVEARRAEIVFADPLEDDPLVAGILADHALEISRNPSQETVIIVSHGPTSEADNEITLEMLGRFASDLRESGGFAEVLGKSLQDDAPPAVRAANVEKLRAAVKRANEEGREVLVVTNLIGTRTIQASLRNDLSGLEYRFNAKGTIEHPNFVRWMEQTVQEALRERF